LLCTAPLADVTDYNETFARLIYQGATCIDNGCATCTCAGCPKAFCPLTNANDVGSYGSSALQWLINQGKLKGYTTADTTAQLVSCLAKGPAMIGVDWRDSMWTPDVTGHLQVSLAATLDGGHELRATEYDANSNDVIVLNSWGAWGWCYKSRMTANTPNDGTGCGFARIRVADLPQLNFDADCPVP
jgi:hypothetical protein